MNAVKSLFSKYVAHLAGYITSAATIVAVIDPAGLSPQGKLAIGIAGLVVTAAHHGYSAGTGTGAAQAAVDAAAKALAAVAKPAVLVLALCLVLPLMHGCATIAKLATPSAQPYIVVAVDVAVATAESKGVPAAQINAVCKVALAADSGTAATLATVATVVNAEIAKLNLPPADLAAALILEDALSVAIQAQVGANPDVATAQAVVANVLQAAIRATGG